MRKCLLLALPLLSCGGTRDAPPGARTDTVALLAATPAVSKIVAQASPLALIDGALRPRLRESKLPSLDARFPLRARGLTRIAVSQFDGVWIEIRAEVPVDAPAVHDGQVVTYASVAPATDLAMFESDGVAEEIRVLRDASAPATLRWSIALGPALAKVRLAPGGEIVEVLDHQGRARLRATPIVAFDANGVRRALDVTVTSDGLVATLDRTGLAYPIVVDPAWGTTGSMSVARFAAGAAKLADGRVLVAGGNATSTQYDTSASSLSAAEIFDPATLSFTTTGAMTLGVHAHTLTTLPSGKVLSAGGPRGALRASSADIYDPVAGTWSPATPMVSRRARAAAVLLPNAKVIVVGGHQDTGTWFSTAEIYDPANNTWTTTTTNIRTGCTGQTSGALLGTSKAIFACDASGNTDVYDSATSAFTAGPTLTLGRTGARWITLADGRVLVTGGYSTTAGIVSSELLAPGGGGWTAAGNMLTGHAQASSTLLSDGRVLIAGGSVLSTAPTLVTSELFDPVTESWSAGPGLVASRADAFMVALANGRAILGGGRTGTSTPLSTVELYGDGALVGTSCAAGGACLSGFCADGVCCDRACSGACESCNEAGSVGTCTVVTGPSRVGHPVCNGTGTCGGTCDGVAATCTVPAATVVCLAGTCTGGIAQPAAFCTGSGACGTTPATTACAPYVCGATACKTSCALDTDCVSTHACVGGACVARKTNGGTCTSNGGCTSGFCADGVCCNEACDAACRACNLSGSAGTCSPVDGVADPHGKCTTGECTAVCKAGACGFKAASASCGADACVGAALTKKGTCSGTDEKCTAPAPTACPDGLNCADASSCKPRCATATDCASGVCDAASGKCTGATATDAGVATDVGVASGPKVDPGPKPTVAEFQRCAKGSECPTGHCVDGVCCDTACTDRCHSCALLTSPGKCTLAPIGVDLRNECGPSAQCLGTCGDKGECIGSGNGTMCVRNRCVGPSKGLGPAYCPAPGGKCATDDQVAFDCTPYACEPAFGACISACKSSDDCANGFVCDVTTKACVAPPPPADEGGCAMGRSGSTTGALALVGIVGLAALRNRRRATRRA